MKNDDNLYTSFGFEEKSMFIGTMIFMELFNPISFVLEKIQLKMSRIFEFQADRYAKTHNME